MKLQGKTFIIIIFIIFLHKTFSFIVFVYTMPNFASSYSILPMMIVGTQDC